MLKQRLLTALLLIPPVLGLVWWLPSSFFAALTGMVIVLAALEWAHFAGLSPVAARLYAAITVALGLPLMLGPDMLNAFLVGSAALFWLLVCVWFLPRFRQRAVAPATAEYEPWLLLLGMALLLPCWLAVVQLQHAPPWQGGWVWLLFALIWGADSAAYFAGRRWGQRKLLVKVSPGKTLEGVAGGLLAVLCLAVVVAVSQSWTLVVQLAFVLLCLLVGVISVAGDLLESWAKRRRGLKDSGTLLPGHGGVMDRIDSLIAAAPVFYIGLLALGLLQ